MVIARFVAATKPEVRPLPDAETQALADLVARRRQIIAMIVAERQREKRAAAGTGKSIVRLLKARQKELNEIDDTLESLEVPKDHKPRLFERRPCRR